MKLGILGLGYVGLTSAACLIKEGHTVIGVEPDTAKRAMLAVGVCPIAEPGVGDLLALGTNERRWEVHADILAASVDRCDAVLVCVGSPGTEEGDLDLTHVAFVSRGIADLVARTDRTRPLPVVYRSTMPPGSMDRTVLPAYAEALGSERDRLVELVFNPEFMRETTAVRDYFNPARIVVGTMDGRPSAILAELYRNIDAPSFVTRYAEAELVKLVDNTWHATKVAFANEIGRLCLALGLDTAVVNDIFLADTKLNVSARYLRPGAPFGGSCLPKDIRALNAIGGGLGVDTPVIGSVMASNEVHKRALLKRCLAQVSEGAHVLMVGIAFKPESDDLRESPYLELAADLIAANIRVSVYDPFVDPQRLIGRNLQEVQQRLPGLVLLLIDEETARRGAFDAVIDTADWARRLGLDAGNVVRVNKL